MEYTEKQIEKIKAELDPVSYEEIENIYSSQLDEMYEPVELGFITVYPSQIKDLDPTAFRCAVLDFIDLEYLELGGDEGYYYLEDVNDLDLDDCEEGE